MNQIKDKSLHSSIFPKPENYISFSSGKKVLALFPNMKLSYNILNIQVQEKACIYYKNVASVKSCMITKGTLIAQIKFTVCCILYITKLTHRWQLEGGSHLLVRVLIVYTCMSGDHVEGEDHFCELVLSFCCMVPRDPSQMCRLGCKLI